VVRAASSVSVLSKGGECWWGERKEAMTQGIGMDFVHGCLLSVGSMINAFTFHDAVCCVVLCCVVLCCVVLCCCLLEDCLFFSSPQRLWEHLGDFLALETHSNHPHVTARSTNRKAWRFIGGRGGRGSGGDDLDFTAASHAQSRAGPDRRHYDLDGICKERLLVTVESRCRLHRQPHSLEEVRGA
jgi:hypothetical protein